MHVGKLDKLQYTILKKKFSSFFHIINDVYISPKATNSLINRGIAYKLSRQYQHKDGIYFSNRKRLENELNEINFTQFFTIQKIEYYKAKKIFLMFKHPENHINIKTHSPDKFMKYVFKKYCNELSSVSLYSIFSSSFDSNLTKSQSILKDAIYEIASSRGSIINRLAALFETSENQKEVQYSKKLKDHIDKLEFKIVQQKQYNNKEPDLELNIVRSFYKQ